MTDATTSSDKPRLATVRQFCERHPFMSEGGLRHLIFNARSTGFSGCIRRIGRRVYIDETAFFQWIGNDGKKARNE